MHSRNVHPGSMSLTRGRHGVGVCLLLIGAAAAAHAQGVRQLPVVFPGMCPREYCCLGEWSTRSASVQVFGQPGDRDRPVAVVPERTDFKVDSSVEVAVRLGIAVVDRAVKAYASSVYDSTMLAPGDTVYLMLYDGEDVFHAVYRGQPLAVEAFWAGPPGMLRPDDTPTYGRVIQDLRSEWWVRVRLSSGIVGWIQPTETLQGLDACESHPLRPNRR